MLTLLRALRLAASAALLLLPCGLLRASDHADPVRLPTPFELLDDAKPKTSDLQLLTGGITDLFIFPVDDNDRAISFPRANERRRAITDSERAKLNTLTAAQRADLLKDPSRAGRSEKLTAAAPVDAASATTASREEIARFERLSPAERLDWKPLAPDEVAQAKALVFILCVRRELPPAGYKLDLKPYTYTIHMDPETPVDFETSSPDAPEQTRVYSERARYGGSLQPGVSKQIQSHISFSFRLDDEARLVEFKDEGLSNDMARQKIVKFPSATESGIRDDPFIFPPFFRTNVVAMAVKVPIECFPANKRSWILWCNSTRDGKQVDHGGRSLRTQQPRFAPFLNDYEPKDQVAAIEEERAHPSLLRDALVRFNIPALFNFRNWDLFPDVMIYNMAYDCHYPNGRLLTDDVAAELAENGDTLLVELSYVGDTWPRRNFNDKPFLPKFPFLAMPWTPAEVANDPLPANPPVLKDPLKLSAANKWFLILVTLGSLLVLLFLGFLLGKWWARKKWKARYL